MEQLERKADGEMRPRIESHANVASHLRRFVSPRLGRKIATEVTRQEVAQLSQDIVEGKLGKPSVSNARHMRRALSGLYSWAADPEQDFVPVTCQPCIKLGKLLGPYGSVRGARGNSRPYRDSSGLSVKPTRMPPSRRGAF